MTRPSERDDGPARVRIPADVEQPDRILAGLTARQLAILAATTVLMWLAYLAVGRWVPARVFGALATPVLAVALVVAVGRRDGIGADRWLLAALRHARTPHRRVPAPDRVPAAPPWAGHDPNTPPAPLQLPATGVDDAGLVDLGRDGTALVCAASTVGFALRTPAEQEALVAAFGRYLNSLTLPIQLLITARPVDLRPVVARLRADAGGLPHPALEAAALAHADYLGELAATRDLLTRQVLVVLREPGRPTAAGPRLRRRAADTASALGAAGITLTPLDADAAAACLRAAFDPWCTDAPAEAQL